MARTSFTKEDDERLVSYIARYNPGKANRLGNKLYQKLSENEEGLWSWASRHSWNSWRQRYKENEVFFDKKIKKYQAANGINPDEELVQLKPKSKPRSSRDDKSSKTSRKNEAVPKAGTNLARKTVMMKKKPNPVNEDHGEEEDKDKDKDKDKDEDGESGDNVEEEKRGDGKVQEGDKMEEIDEEEEDQLITDSDDQPESPPRPPTNTTVQVADNTRVKSPVKKQGLNGKKPPATPKRKRKISENFTPSKPDEKRRRIASPGPSAESSAENGVQISQTNNGKNDDSKSVSKTVSALQGIFQNLSEEIRNEIIKSLQDNSSLVTKPREERSTNPIRPNNGDLSKGKEVLRGERSEITESEHQTRRKETRIVSAGSGLSSTTATNDPFLTLDHAALLRKEISRKEKGKERALPQDEITEKSKRRTTFAGFPTTSKPELDLRRKVLGSSNLTKAAVQRPQFPTRSSYGTTSRNVHDHTRGGLSRRTSSSSTIDLMEEFPSPGVKISASDQLLVNRAGIQFFVQEIARNHGFSESWVRSIYEEVQDLRTTDRIIHKMRIAAQRELEEAIEHETSNIEAGPSSNTNQKHQVPPLNEPFEALDAHSTPNRSVDLDLSLLSHKSMERSMDTSRVKNSRPALDYTPADADETYVRVRNQFIPPSASRAARVVKSQIRARRSTGGTDASSADLDPFESGAQNKENDVQYLDDLPEDVDMEMQASSPLKQMSSGIGEDVHLDKLPQLGQTWKIRGEEAQDDESVTENIADSIPDDDADNLITSTPAIKGPLRSRAPANPHDELEYVPSPISESDLEEESQALEFTVEDRLTQNKINNNDQPQPQPPSAPEPKEKRSLRSLTKQVAKEEIPKNVGTNSSETVPKKDVMKSGTARNLTWSAEEDEILRGDDEEAIKQIVNRRGPRAVKWRIADLHAIS